MIERPVLRCLIALAGVLFLNFGTADGQAAEEGGHSIGRVSTHGKLIVVELDAKALGRANPFNLAGRTLRFTPTAPGYKIEKLALRWNPDFGPEFTGAQARLSQFTFPFAGRAWNSFLVGTTGSLRFGSTDESQTDVYGHPEAGIVLDRFDQLAEVAGRLGDKGPAIAVFLKPRLQGRRYVKELSDRVIVTWDLTEPYGSYLDFGWFKTVNRFQAVLHRNGVIEMSYRSIAAKDAIVGIFPGTAAMARPAEVHFASIRPGARFRAPFEAFHYLAAPKPQDLSCTVIEALGDRFDFLAYYSDFRTDTQEASPPSDGPIGGSVTGIGDTLHDQSPPVLGSRCTKGRFQQGYGGPVFAGANEAQRGPPAGAPADSDRNITFYSGMLSKAAAPYNYAVGHLGHEFGHRWGAYVTAMVGGKSVRLGPWPHWALGLQAPVAFPYSLPAEASTLGGALWQPNADGTYTRVRAGFFVPASGYSYLDLYLMGLARASEVPDFFLLNNLVQVGEHANGRAVFKADRTNISVRDVIAAEGPRLPDADHSQRAFNTGFVVMVEHRRRPSAKLLLEAEGIRRQWIAYWDTVTGQRSSMSTDPR